MARWHRIREELPRLLRAYRLVWSVRTRLWILSFRELRERLNRAPVCPDPPPDRPTPMHLAWTVVIASRFVPAASCLTQALATDLLLRAYGYQGIVHIGVAFKGNRKLTAHAWLEYDGAIIIGGRGHHDFQPLPSGKL